MRATKGWFRRARGWPAGRCVDEGRGDVACAWMHGKGGMLVTEHHYHVGRRVRVKVRVRARVQVRVGLYQDSLVMCAGLPTTSTGSSTYSTTCDVRGQQLLAVVSHC